MATIRHYRNKLKVQSFPHEVKPEQLNDPSKVTFYDPSWYMYVVTQIERADYQIGENSYTCLIRNCLQV